MIRLMKILNFYYNKQSTLKFIFSGTRHINMEITILKGNTKNKFVLFDSNFKDNKTIVFLRPIQEEGLVEIHFLTKKKLSKK